MSTVWKIFLFCVLVAFAILAIWLFTSCGRKKGIRRIDIEMNEVLGSQQTGRYYHHCTQTSDDRFVCWDTLRGKVYKTVITVHRK